MHTAPGNFEALLLAGHVWHEIVYEMELDGGTLRYAAEDLSWNDGATTHGYTGLAMKSSNILEQLGKRVPECRVTFSNIDNTLLSNLLPTDNITNQRMAIRLLLHDTTTGVLEPDSLILFYGFMQAPRRWKQDKLDITVIRIDAGARSQTPPDSVVPWCQVHEFRDWTATTTGQCNYVKSAPHTQVASSSTGTLVTLTGSGSDFETEVAARGAGKVPITISVRGPHYIQSVSGDVITLTEAAIANVNEWVAFYDCPRKISNCQRRANNIHEFRGFRGIASPGLRRVRQAASFGPGGYTTHRYILNSGLPHSAFWGLEEIEGEGSASLADHSQRIPLVYGRRKMDDLLDRLVDEYSFAYPSDSDARVFKSRMCLLSEGEIEGPQRWWQEDDAGTEKQGDPSSNLPGGASGKVKVFGSYWRAGGPGVATTEGESAYAANPINLKRDQNHDFYSTSQDTLSGIAYMTFIKETVPDEDSDDGLSGLAADVKGILCQKYSDSSSTTQVGSPVWTRNPVWEAINAWTKKRYGSGRWLTEDDIDFTVTQPTAAIGDVLNDGFSSTVTVTVTGSALCTVQSTEGFQRGMRVRHKDGTSYTVVEILSDTEMTLSGIPVQVIGDIMTAEIPRYECNLVIDKKTETSKIVLDLLRHCSGYVTLNAEGKIQVRSEGTESYVAHFYDETAAEDAGYGIIENSLELISGYDGRSSKNTNRVFVKFTDQENEVVDRVYADDEADIIKYGVTAEALTYSGYDNVWHAQQMASMQKGRRTVLGPGAVLTVGAIGVLLQVGNIIRVDHGVVQWTDEDKRIIKKEILGLGSRGEMTVKLTLEDYQASIYGTGRYVQNEYASLNKPAITLYADEVSNGRIILTWLESGGNLPPRSFSIFKSTATMGGAPDLSQRIATVGPGSPGNIFGIPIPAPGMRRYTYRASAREFGTELFFQVRANMPPYAGVLSNEVSAIPTDLDPGGDIGSPFNMLLGGDFNEPADWTETKTEGTAIRPNTHDEATPTTAAKGPYTPFEKNATVPENAYDTDADTGANVRLSDATNERSGATDFLFTSQSGSGAKTGYITVNNQVNNDVVDYNPNAGWMRLWHHDDNDSLAGDWNEFIARPYAFSLQPEALSRETRSSQVFNIGDLGDLRVRLGAAIETGNAGEVYHFAFDVQFLELTAPVAVVAESLGTVIGTGNTHGNDSDYAVLRRPFPGRNPIAGETVFAVGEEATTQLWARKRIPGSTIDHDLEVALYDKSSDTTTVLLTISKDDVEDEFKPWGGYIVFTSAINGDMELLIRSKDENGWQFDTGSVTRGRRLWRVSSHRQEPSSEGDQKDGRSPNYPRGDWSGTGDVKKGLGS